MTHIFLSTFNCAKLQQQEQFPRHLSNILPSITANNSSDTPDLFIFGFQELLSIYDCTFPETVQAYLEQLATAVLNVLNDRYASGYSLLKAESFGGVGLCIISKSSLRDGVRDFNVRKTSLGWFYSNLKTSVLVSFRILNNGGGLSDEEGTRYTFINGHFCANEGIEYFEKRNKDYWNVIRNTFVPQDDDKETSVLEMKGHVFLMGDLNYRAVSNIEGEEEVNEGLLQENDELQKALNAKLAFVGFKEAHIDFKPSYKFNLGTNVYNTKRIPSWCDRILYRKYDNNDEQIIKYQSIPDIISSDHKPVILNIKTSDFQPSKPIIRNGELIDKEVHVELPDPLFTHKQQLGTITTLLVQFGLFSGTTTKGRLITIGVLTLFIIYLYA